MQPRSPCSVPQSAYSAARTVRHEQVCVYLPDRVISRLLTDSVMYSTLIDAFAFAEAISAATDVEGDTSRQATLTGVVIGLQVHNFRLVVLLLFH